MKPFSAVYYICKNKGRSAVIIFMMFLTMCMFLAGNYISSLWWYYDVAAEYDDRIATVTALSTDTDYIDWHAFLEEIKKDEELVVLGRTGNGFPGEQVTTTMGLKTGTGSYVFSSAEDMQKAFDILGISCECGGLKDRDCVASENMAKNLGWKIGDLNSSKEFRLAATMDDESYVLFFLYEVTEEYYYRVNVMSETLSGDEIRDHISRIIGDKKVWIEKKTVDSVYENMKFVDIIYYSGIVILSIILAVTLNSVVTGQYIKREYEFAVYRAIGVQKGRIRRKVAEELWLMDLIALIAGIVFMTGLTFMLNELLYIPGGQYLPYVSKTGLIGVALSNLMVLMPLTIIKGRRMCKKDITEF